MEWRLGPPWNRRAMVDLLSKISSAAPEGAYPPEFSLRMDLSHPENFAQRRAARGGRKEGCAQTLPTSRRVQKNVR